jgi:RNA polymerase sigma-70 factor (sigma-E family)
MMATGMATTWDEPFVDLYRDRYDAMVRLAYLLTGDRAAAEELTQDAFVAVHRNWGRASNPPAYLRTAVVNACRSWGRRKVLERDRRPAPPEPSMLAADELWDTLLTLPERQRTAVVLRFYEDLPDAEIADVLGCRQGTVRTLVHRALAALKEELS